jgi:Zn-finger nucleic acid-binding protein
VTTDRCAGCGGTWFDGDEVEHAIDVTTKGVSREEADAMRRALPVPPTASEPIRYLPCVRCGERMQRRQVAPRAGTIVDVCRDHGVWFDGGEFERFADFVKRGGLDVLRHDGVAAAEARRKAAEAERMVQAHGSLGDLRPGDLRRADPTLILTGAVARDILRTIGRLFRG